MFFLVFVKQEPDYLRKYEKFVVKVGTNAITLDDGGINRNVVDSIAKDVSKLFCSDKDIVLVSSGAIACGKDITTLVTHGFRKEDIDAVYSSIGQATLQAAWETSFRKKGGVNVAQVLPSYRDLDSKTSLENLRRRYKILRTSGVIPIFNENDIFSSEEIRFGDNSVMSAYILGELGFDLLLILTTYDGLLKDGKIVRFAKSYDARDYDKIEQEISFGGLAGALKAAEKVVNEHGKVCIFGNASTDIEKILKGQAPRTVFR